MTPNQSDRTSTAQYLSNVAYHNMTTELTLQDRIMALILVLDWNYTLIDVTYLMLTIFLLMINPPSLWTKARTLIICISILEVQTGVVTRCGKLDIITRAKTGAVFSPLKVTV